MEAGQLNELRPALERSERGRLMLAMLDQSNLELPRRLLQVPDDLDGFQAAAQLLRQFPTSAKQASLTSWMADTLQKSTPVQAGVN